MIWRRSLMASIVKKTMLVAAIGFSLRGSSSSAMKAANFVAANGGSLTRLPAALMLPSSTALFERIAVFG